MKVCVISGSRAEYGLLKPLIDTLNSDGNIRLQLVVTGMHLSPEFGLTYEDIMKDGLEIDEKVEILLSSDHPIGVCKSMGLGLISFAESYQRLAPDIVLVLGDRFEIFAAVTSAMVMNIPVAHIHGGESTQGVYDEGFRHSISKMSQIHFTSTEEYRKRVIQLGESPESVHNVGALAIDVVQNTKLLTKRELEESLNFDLTDSFFIVTYHPVTLERNTVEKQMFELLNALDSFTEHRIIFTKPNADHGGRIISKMINQYVSEHYDRARVFDSLGQLKYFSALKYADMMIGNSSSGILEMPLFGKPTINIGDRQKGRIEPESIITCVPSKYSIEEAIKLGLDGKFLNRIKDQKNPYGIENTANKIKGILLKTDFSNILKKEFYDINFELV